MSDKLNIVVSKPLTIRRAVRAVIDRVRLSNEVGFGSGHDHRQSDTPGNLGGPAVCSNHVCEIGPNILVIVLNFPLISSKQLHRYFEIGLSFCRPVCQCLAIGLLKILNRMSILA